MKRDWLRADAAGVGYRAHATDRWPSLRLTAPGDAAPELSYAAFGCFEVGRQDFIGHHLYRLDLRRGDEPVRCEEGASAFLGRADAVPGTSWLRLVFALAEGGGSLTVDYAFGADAVGLRLGFEGADLAAGFSLRFTGHLLYPQNGDNGGDTAYYASPGAGNGLSVGAAAPAKARARTEKSGTSLIEVSVPPGVAALTCRLCPFRTGGAEAAPGDGTMPPVDFPERWTPVEAGSVPAWEPEAMRARGWRAPRGRVGRRVAGLLVSVREWHHAQSKDPNTAIGVVAQKHLPRVLESGAFDEIGLSRDGIWELGHHERWLGLVERAHAAGLPVIMKPGDQELTAVIAGDQVDAWVAACFDQPAERQCDRVRLCWEALMWAWTTADLCIRPDVLPPDFPDIAGCSWPEAEAALVDAVAGKFDALIRKIRHYAPEVTVDLECGDTRVFRELLRRHDNLGVMYMCYGEYPRVTDYLDLYFALGREGLGAERVVLETDCYYTAEAFDIWKLRERPVDALYTPGAIERMVAKHRHMNGLAADAAWAWGLNVNFHEAKFRAICEAGGSA